MLSNLDYELFHFINDQANRFVFLNGLMTFFAQDIQYAFALGIIIYWFSGEKRNRRMVVEALLSMCIGMGISYILGHIFYRDRPFVTHSVIQLIQHPANASFPSDHAIGAFAIATVFWLYRTKFSTFWLLAALLIAFSRIWTGVHYPTDVVAGAVIGVASVMGTHYLMKHLKILEQFILSGIDLYEKIEKRLWRKSTKSH
jgi:undecaprenyl-diphosphatase